MNKLLVNIIKYPTRKIMRTKNFPSPDNMTLNARLTHLLYGKIVFVCILHYSIELKGSFLTQSQHLNIKTATKYRGCCKSTYNFKTIGICSLGGMQFLTGTSKLPQHSISANHAQHVVCRLSLGDIDLFYSRYIADNISRYSI